MNVAADDLALLLRVGDAGQAIEEQLRRRRRRRSGSCSRSKRVRTCAASSRRMQAVVDEDARQPIADRAGGSACAATVESTPPDSPQTTRPSPTCARMRADRLVDERRHRPVAGAAADVEREVAQDLRAAIGVRDLGMKQQRVVAALRRRHRRRPARWRSSRSRRIPAAPPSTKSPWLAQTRSSVRSDAEQRRVAAAMRIVAWPNSRCGARRHLAAEHVRSSAACRSRCRAPARRASNTRAIAVRRARLRRRCCGPPDRIDADRACRARISSSGVLNGRISRVDRQLAQPPRDQLGELRAEIEDDDGLMGHGRTRRYYKVCGARGTTISCRDLRSSLLADRGRCDAVPRRRRCARAPPAADRQRGPLPLAECRQLPPTASSRAPAAMPRRRSLPIRAPMVGRLVDGRAGHAADRRRRSACCLALRLGRCSRRAGGRRHGGLARQAGGRPRRWPRTTDDLRRHRRDAASR